MGVGLYYSHIDWFDSDFRIDQWNYQVNDNLYARNLPYTRETDPEGFARMIARHREQLRELATRYGPLDLLSLDMWFPEKYGLEPDLTETVKMLRRLQPKMLIRNRGIGAYGDYTTPERDVPIDPESGKDERGRPVDIPWKVIFPGSRHFSHIWQDHYHPAEWIVHKLVDISAKGGVFQIGYGPLPDGDWPPQVERLLEETGRWLAVNGEGIYGTRRHTPWREGETVRYTRTKDRQTVYAFLLEWPGAPLRGGLLRLEGVRAAPGAEVKMLGTDHALRYRQDEHALTIELPAGLADPDRRPCRHAWTFRIPVEDA